MSKNYLEQTPELDELLVKAGSQRKEESLDAVQEIAKALQTPLRQGIMDGDILDGIFEPIQLRENATSEFPLDFLQPGREQDHVAYTIPNHGRIPERHVEGDYVNVPVYDIGSSIDFLLKYARDARWDIVRRANEVLVDGFVKKMNDDGWHNLISAGADRNIMIYDPAANSVFSKRLVSFMKLVMRRNGGGNSTSVNRGLLTDLYMSPEGIEDIRNWSIDEVDEITRRQLITGEGGLLVRVFQVNLHDLDELGIGQEYQLYYDSDLSGTLPTNKNEIVVGLDRSKRDSFVMPTRQAVQIFEDDTLHRQRRAGMYGWAEHGFGVLDTRRVLLGAY